MEFTVDSVSADLSMERGTTALHGNGLMELLGPAALGPAKTPKGLRARYRLPGKTDTIDTGIRAAATSK